MFKLRQNFNIRNIIKMPDNKSREFKLFSWKIFQYIFFIIQTWSDIPCQTVTNPSLRPCQNQVTPK